MYPLKLKLTTIELTELFKILCAMRKYSIDLLHGEDYVHYYNVKKLCFRLGMKVKMLTDTRRQKASFGVDIHESDSLLYVYSLIGNVTDIYAKTLLQSVINTLTVQTKNYNHIELYK